MVKLYFFKLFFLSNIFFFGRIIFPSVLSGTLIRTNEGLVSVEKIKIGDFLVGYDNGNYIESEVTNIFTEITDKISVIMTNNGKIYTATDQLFYDFVTQKWIESKDIVNNTCLLNSRGEYEICLSREVIFVEPIVVYYISTTSPHTFFVYDQELLTHNFAPLIVVGFSWAFGGGLEFVGMTIGTAFLGAIFSANIFKNRNANSDERFNISISRGGSSAGNDFDPEEDDDDDNNENKKHSNGVYEDAPYHHRNSNGRKSPAPKDGQKCLDNSLQVNETQRVYIENNTFVVLKRTSLGLFHGYVSEWRNLNKTLRTFLIKKGFTTQHGKIIKKIIKKV